LNKSSPIALTILLCGCTDWGYEDNGFRHIVAEERADSKSSATFVVPIEEGDTSLLLTAGVDNGLVVLYEVEDPSGTTFLAAEEEWGMLQARTGAVFPADSVSVNWPMTEDDAELTPGKWRFTFRALDADYYYTPGVSIFADTLLKRDAMLSGGVVNVALVYTGGLDQDPLMTAAVDEALAMWRTLYLAVGLELQVTTTNWDTQSLWPPGFGDGQTYTDIAASLPIGTVQVVLVSQVEGFPTGMLYGMAGGIPGPLVDNGHSAVMVDLMSHAGADVLFTEEETRILAETMGHEVGHFLGLFHPNEIDLSGYDALDDTPECTDLDSCEKAMGENLMYPYPICSSFSCTAQSELTDNQSGVMMRYTGVE
jgi:hypothetical protein